MVANNAKYPEEAFEFVQLGLDYTVRRMHGKRHTGSHRHVSGADLCHGLRDFALSRYGLLARTVLKRWRVNSTGDFGRIVFAMIETGEMQKSDDDRLEDFEDVYDFEQAFDRPLQLDTST